MTTNGKANAAGDNIRNIGQTIAARAEDVYETARKQIEQIKKETDDCVMVLNQELDKLLKRTREDTERLSEAAKDQLSILAQRVDDVFLLCNGAVEDCNKHRDLIKTGVTIPETLTRAAVAPPSALADELDRHMEDALRQKGVL